MPRIDPDNPPLTDEQLARLQPFPGNLPEPVADAIRNTLATGAPSPRALRTPTDHPVDPTWPTYLVTIEVDGKDGGSHRVQAASASLAISLFLMENALELDGAESLQLTAHLRP